RRVAAHREPTQPAHTPQPKLPGTNDPLSCDVTSSSPVTPTSGSTTRSAYSQSLRAFENSPFPSRTTTARTVNLLYRPSGTSNKPSDRAGRQALTCEQHVRIIALEFCEYDLDASGMGTGAPRPRSHYQSYFDSAY